MFVIAIQEQHLIFAVLHLELAMSPKPFNQVPFPSVTESQSVNLFIVPLLRTWKYNLIVFIFFFCIYFLPRQLPRLPQRKLRLWDIQSSRTESNMFIPHRLQCIDINFSVSISSDIYVSLVPEGIIRFDTDMVYQIYLLLKFTVPK